MTSREELFAIFDAVAAPAKSCQEDGCRHYAGYQDSGSDEWCACHFWDDDNDLVVECEGQPDPLPPYRERLADAILAAFENEGRDR